MMTTNNSSMPTVYLRCRPLERFWRLAQEHAMRTGSAPEYVFGSIGLLFVDPADFKVFCPTPDNAMVFARTGSNGVHYSLLHVDNEVCDVSPVIMTVPFYAYIPNVVVGENLLDFLSLGCEVGYSEFDLTWRSSDIARDGTPLRQAGIDAIQSGYLALDLEPEDLALLKLIREQMGLKPWLDIARHLDELEARFLKDVHPSPLLDPPD